MKRLGLLVAVMLVAVVLYRPATGQDNHEGRIAALETRVSVLEAGSAATPVAAGATYTIRGVVSIVGVRDRDVAVDGEGCGGADGSAYDDVARGEDVYAYDGDGDGDGDDIGTGSFGAGVPEEIDATRVRCVLPFSVDDLPRADRYVLVFGAQERSVGYAFDELAGRGWEVEITV